MFVLKRNLSLFLLSFVLFVSSVFVHADEQSITVSATGRGINKTEALEDAFRDAVIKAVGSYVVTQSTLKEGDFEEDIYINADAVVASHKVIASSEQDGIYSITIEASVVKNDLLKYIAKTESTTITSTDLANLLNRRKALSTAEKSLDYIFKDIGTTAYLAKRVGDFSLGESDGLDTDIVTVSMRYSLQLNTNEYSKFEQRLKSLLSKFAIEEKSGQATYGEIHGQQISIFTTAMSEGILDDFNSSEQAKQWPDGTKTIAFCDKIDEEGNDQYHFYAVPNQIYQKIYQLTPTYGVLQFEFSNKDPEKNIKRYLRSDLGFFIKKIYGNSERSSETIEFRNWMSADPPGYDTTYFSQKEFKTTWQFRVEQLRKMETCTIKAYSGEQAEFSFYRANGSKSDMRKLAMRGYFPAMIAMVEQFDETKTWYHRAALLGSTYAQEKVKWKNGGLGFEIKPSDGRFIVGSVRKGVPVSRGLFIKSINNTEFKYDGDRSLSEISKFIGNLSPETSVSIKFTDGKEVDVKTQEK